MKSSQSQAMRVGFFLARLVREKSVDIKKPDFMRQVKTICASSQGMFSVPGDPEPSQKQWEILADALQSGWIEGGKADPPPAPEPAPKADKANRADAAKAETEAPDAPKSSPAAATQQSKNGEHKEGGKKA
jgi:hypothetical protein